MEKEQAHIVSVSGGKDSAAMLLGMVERGMRIDEAVFYDLGMDFPECAIGLKQLEKVTGLEISIVRPKHDFAWWLLERESPRTGRIGAGWPNFRIGAGCNRWCSGLKRECGNAIAKRHAGKEIVRYIGIAADEPRRLKPRPNIVYPLAEWGMTERDCLAACLAAGIDFGGYYNTNARMGCWCCPMSRIGELRGLYHERPELWARLRELDDKVVASGKKPFYGTKSVRDLEERFKKEDEKEKE